MRIVFDRWAVRIEDFSYAFIELGKLRVTFPMIAVFSGTIWKTYRPGRDFWQREDVRELIADWCAGTNHPATECLMEQLFEVKK